MSIKLCLALRIAELFGIIQSPSSSHREVIVIINSVFGCLYTLISLHGCFIFVSFMMTKKMKRYCRCFFTGKKDFNRESFHLSTLNTNGNSSVAEKVKQCIYICIYIYIYIYIYTPLKP